MSGISESVVHDEDSRSSKHELLSYVRFKIRAISFDLKSMLDLGGGMHSIQFYMC